MSTDTQAHAALSAADGAFHEVYAAARDAARHDVPVLVVSATQLALHVRGERREYSFTRPGFFAAKAAAHAAVASFTLASGSGAPECVRIEALTALEQKIGAASAVDGASNRDLHSVLETVLGFLRSYLSGERRSEDVARFAARVGPQILQLTEVTTREQVAALHEAAEQALAALSEPERAQLQVVVIGDHQARVRSMGMQYFQRRFGELPETTDERVTFGENVSTEDEALALVATRRLDEAIAHAFFGDAKRLQRDVLGDAAQRCIAGMTLSPIG